MALAFPFPYARCFKVKRVGFWCKEAYIKARELGAVPFGPVFLGVAMYIFTNMISFIKRQYMGPPPPLNLSLKMHHECSR